MTNNVTPFNPTLQQSWLLTHDWGYVPGQGTFPLWRDPVSHKLFTQENAVERQKKRLEGLHALINQVTT